MYTEDSQEYEYDLDFFLLIIICILKKHFCTLIIKNFFKDKLIGCGLHIFNAAAAVISLNVLCCNEKELCCKYRSHV